MCAVMLTWLRLIFSLCRVESRHVLYTNSPSLWPFLLFCCCFCNRLFVVSLFLWYVVIHYCHPSFPPSSTSNMNPGLQYSHSSLCLSTHNILSETRSSMAVLALALGHRRFNMSIETLTYPSSCAASNTAL